MIEISELSCGYRGQTVLDNASCKILPGQITVIIGQNGSGKSTLARVLAGLKLDFRGQVNLDELSLGRFTSVRALRQKVGLVLQNPDHQILFSKVSDEINFTLQNLKLPELYDLPKGRAERAVFVQAQRTKIVREVLTQVGLADDSDRDPRKLSGGQKQRLAIANVLASHPDYIILDEATTMLDLTGRRQIYQILDDLKAKNIGIVMLTNLLEEILLADIVLVIHDGKIQQFTPAEIIQNAQILTDAGLEMPLLLQVAQKFGVHKLQDLRSQL